MLIKRISIFKRFAKSWRGNRFKKDEMHTELVVRTSWLLFGIVPVYVSEVVRTDNL